MMLKVNLKLNVDGVIAELAGWWSKCWHYQGPETTAMELEELNKGELININEKKKWS